MREIKLKSTTSDKELIFTEGGVGSAESAIIACTFGEDFSGKSRLAATGPERVGAVILDRKSRYTIENTAKEFKRKLLMPKDDLVREGNLGVRVGWNVTEELNDAKAHEMNNETKKAYRAHVNRVKDLTWALHDNDDVRVILIDLFEQFYQDVKYAHYGRTGNLVRKLDGGKIYKDTSEADQEIVDFINSIADKHLILTHRRKEEYEKNVNTGRWTWSGYKWLGHNVNLVVEHTINKKYDPSSEREDLAWHYSLNVRKCLHNVQLEGPDGQGLLKDEWITFQNLAMAIFPESDPKSWI